jgi:hypothetical protein
VLGQKPLPAPVPVEVEFNQDAMRRFEDQLYWEDYWARNEDDTRPKKRKSSQAKPAKALGAGVAPCQHQGVGDDSVPLLVELAPNRTVGRSGARRVAPTFDATAGHVCTSES